jgi:hypothetical protein
MLLLWFLLLLLLLLLLVSGAVVRVSLSSSGSMQDPPAVFSQLRIKRPSGLSFDHQGAQK